MEQLIKTEEEVVNLTEKAIDKAENTTVKYLLQAIQHDSRKHADFGRAALEILDFKASRGGEGKKRSVGFIEKT